MPTDLTHQLALVQPELASYSLLDDLTLQRGHSQNDIDIRFTGLDCFLQHRRLITSLYHAPDHGPDKLRKNIQRHLKSLATKQRRREEQALKGMAIERPVAGLLNNLGIDLPLFAAKLKAARLGEGLWDAMRAIKAHYTEARVQDIFPDLKNLSITVDDGIIHGCFNMTNQVLWRMNHLVVRRTLLPEIMRDSIKGGPLTTVVQHPDLEGMTIHNVVQSQGKGANICLYIKHQDYLDIG